MRRRVVEFDHWRHFEGVAGDLEVTVLAGEVNDINIPRAYMVQGARDFETKDSPSIDLEKIPAQRGWRMIPIHLTQSEQGIVQSTQSGFTYHCYREYEGPDCFNYIMSNGSQETNVARVLLNVVRGYRYDVNLYRHTSLENQFTFRVMGLRDTELEKPTYQLFTWSKTEKYLKYNPVLDRMQVEERHLVIASYSIHSWWHQTGYGGYWVHAVRHNPQQITYLFKDDEELNGYPIGDTDQVYVARGNLPQMYLDITMYFGALVTSRSERTRIDLSELFGERWWECGNAIEIA